jgi:GNAT superfamily N-acetyltransferase
MNTSVTIEHVSPAMAFLYKAVRLRALRDSPTAFSSTFAREVSLSDEEWIERAKRCSGSDCAAYLALIANDACGIVRGSSDEHDPTIVWVESMWVDPSYRRSGIGRRLIDTVLCWARNRHCCAAKLEVTRSNEVAIRFYSSLGFAMTGKTSPYPHGSNLVECEMSLPLC